MLHSLVKQKPKVVCKYWGTFIIDVVSVSGELLINQCTFEFLKCFFNFSVSTTAICCLLFQVNAESSLIRMGEFSFTVCSFIQDWFGF